MLSRLPTILALAWIAFSKPAHSEDTLASVMQQMQPESAVKIAYRETRFLELIEKPWQATGFLYALAPDVLVKEQQTPVREVMGANRDRMYYFDPAHDVRRNREMESGDPLSLNVAAFKALVTGDRQLLGKMYRIEFCSNPGRWTLTLTGHEAKKPTVKIIVTGNSGQQANKIVLHQPDGDRSEFILAEAARGDHLKESIRQLNRELLGE